MKICPVCNDSFTDELNFCDIDGTRLAREGTPQERNKWWSFLGAALLVGGLVISAASIIFLPKSRVSPPVVSSEPQAVPATPKPSASDTVANTAAPAVSAEPESLTPDVAVPEVKKRDRALANGNFAGATPNPKAAALDSERAEKSSPPADADHTGLPSPKKPDAAPVPVKSVSDTRVEDSPAKPALTPSEIRKDSKQPATAKSSDKDSHDKKKTDEKDKKKGGFLRVFKKIFGKD